MNCPFAKFDKDIKKAVLAALALLKKKMREKQKKKNIVHVIFPKVPVAYAGPINSLVSGFQIPLFYSSASLYITFLFFSRKSAICKPSYSTSPLSHHQIHHICISR